MILIGIDPGVKTGMAMWNTTQKTLTLKSLSIHEAMSRVNSLNGAINPQDDNLLVFIEDARKRKHFDKDVSYKAQGAGSVKRDCKIWEDFLTDMKIPFILRHPRNTNIGAQRFKAMTGYQGVTNQHTRDAAMLVFGISENQALALLKTAVK